MDMYQKREQRKNKVEANNNAENSNNININWLMEPYGNTHLKSYKINFFQN